MNLSSVPAVFQLGNLALRTVEAFDENRAQRRVGEYNRALSYLDTAIRETDQTITAMRGGQRPNWGLVSQRAATQLDAAMSILNTLGHTGLGRPGLGDFDVPIPMDGAEVGTGPTTAQMVQGTTQPTAWSNGGPQLTSVVVRLRGARQLIAGLRDAEQARLLQHKVGGGLSGFGDPAQPGGPSLLTYLMLGMIAGAGYHGYKRGGSVASAALWAVAPAFFGLTGGALALAIAAAQGYGKPAGK